MVDKQLFDNYVKYQIDLEKYAAGTVTQIIGLMNAADQDMTEKLKSYSGKGEVTKARMEAIITEMKTAVAAGTKAPLETLQKELVALGSIAANKDASILSQIMGEFTPNEIKQLIDEGKVSDAAKKLLQWDDKSVSVSFAKPSVDQIAAIVNTQPIQGGLLNEWFNKLAQEKQIVVSQQIRLGMAEGATIDEIARKLTGTKQGGYKDGALEVSRRNAEAIVRTAVNHTSNQASHLMYQQNSDIIKGWTFLATLDARTTLICASLSGKKFPLGSGPLPPRHVRCRSFALPELKTWKELGIDLPEFKAGKRASKDGYVPADITFQKWLKGQPPGVQLDILGKTRYEIFKKGSLTIDKFANANGQVHTLDSLNKKYPNVFKHVFGENQPLIPKTTGDLTKASIKAPVHSDYSGIIDNDKIKVKEKPFAASDYDVSGIASKPTQNGVKQLLSVMELHGISGVEGSLANYGAPYVKLLHGALDKVGAPPKMLKAVEKLMAEKFQALEAQKAGFKVAKKEAKSAASIAAKAEPIAAKEIPKAIVPDMPTHTPLDFREFEKVSGKLGSNDGGVFIHKTTGEKWYIKMPGSVSVAQNELTAARLYELGGVEVPDIRAVKLPDGKLGVGSRWVDDLVQSKAILTGAKPVPGLYEGFGMDAWLGDWDVVGLNYDNILLRQGRAIRVDPGGSLLFRAQGGEKGAAFGREVLELDSMRHAGSNAQTASVFKRMTQAQLDDSIRRVLMIDDKDVFRIVNEAGHWSPEERKHVIETLIARKKYLADKFPHLVPRAEAAASTGESILSAQELKFIQDSRINGYVVPTDTTDIEDHHLLLWYEEAKDGSIVTRARLKLTPEGMKKLKLESGGQMQGIVGQDELDAMYEKTLTAIKGIGKQAKEGGVFRSTDIERAREAIKAITEVKTIQVSPDIEGQLNLYLDKWLKEMKDVVKAGEGAPAKWTHKIDVFNKFDLPAPKLSASDEAKWLLNNNYNYKVKVITNGTAKQTGGTMTVSGVDGIKSAWQRTIGDHVATFFGKEAPFALQGIVDIEVAGKNAESMFSVIEKMGINAARSTALDAEELYLRQIAYHRNTAASKAVIKDISKVKNQADRLAQLKTALSNDIGTDVTKMKGYNPEGSYQAFGQGRRVMNRPDMQGPDWDRFYQEHVLYHGNTTGGSLVDVVEKILESGGQMAPTVDKLRRGIQVGGMSPQADLKTGGANYFFTRIYKSTSNGHGFYWDSKLLQRLDSISYSGDNYGRTTGSHVVNNRKSGLSELRSAAGNGSNETIFKNSLSLFDGLKKISVPNADERNKMVALFKKHGISQINGVPIEVIVTM